MPGPDTLPNVARMPPGASLEQAIRRARALVDDPHARVRIVAPSAGSADLARRALGDLGPFIRVRFSTVEVLLSELGVPALARRGLAPEPPGWLTTTIEAEVARLADDGLAGYGATLARPGWTATLEAAVRAVEQARLTPDRLRSIDAPDGVRERLVIVAELLEAITARRDEAKLYSRTDVHVAAAASASGDGLPVHRDQATVVLGDRQLAPAAFEALRAWCQSRPCVRLGLYPLENLAPAPHGIRAAAQSAELVLPDLDTATGSHHLRRWLFVEDATAATSTTDVEAIRNLDEHREVRAAVRRALEAIHAGTPLDRIAFVLPDPSSAALLKDALAEADVPATWLTGPPLSTAGPARLLLHAIALSDGADTTVDWYRFLRTPSLRLRARLGPAAVRGRGRWRSLLREVGVSRDTTRILDGLTKLEDGLDAEEDANKIAATRALAQSIRALREDFDAWPESAPFATHVKAWVKWVERWASSRPERAAVTAVLKSIGRPAGPNVGRQQARRTLERILRGTPWLGGGLDDPTVRVLPPMEMIGGEFDLVCVLGLTEGRFPTARTEDPLITDALVEAVHTATDVRLDDSDARRRREVRRFAATVSATRGALWLSVPAYELTTARPVAPSTLLFDVKAALQGERATLAELEDWLAAPDCDPVGAPNAPDRALSESERRLARARRAPQDAVEPLAHHVVARRLLGLHRSIDRLRAGLSSDALHLDAWSGRIDPDVFAAALEARTLGPGAVRRLVAQPHRFFFQDLLRAWPASYLPGAIDPTDPKWIRGAVQSALVRAETWAALSAEPNAWLDRVLEDEPDLAQLAEQTREIARGKFRADLELVGEHVEALRDARPITLPETPVADTPWSLAERETWRTDDAVLTFTGGDVPKTLKTFDRDFDTACVAVAALDLDVGHTIAIGKAKRVAGAPTVGEGRTDLLAPELIRALHVCHARARAGLWPFFAGKNDKYFRLEREPAFDKSDVTLEARLTAGLESSR